MALYASNAACKVELINRDLWQKFSGVGTEMIITKNGRRIFPPLQINAVEWDPKKRYTVCLDITPISDCRYKYSAECGWTPSGTEEVHCGFSNYVHPDSPALGSHWMSKPICFKSVKLTNKPGSGPNEILLSSMHKYQPRIVIVEAGPYRFPPTTVVAFPETLFVAVTAYQNPQVTQLKIESNPFAKGFRLGGLSQRKRRRAKLNEEDDADVRSQTAPVYPSKRFKDFFVETILGSN